MSLRVLGLRGCMRMLTTASTPKLQGSIVAALSSDLGKVAQLVEQAGEQVAADPAASVQVRGGRGGRGAEDA